MKLFALFAHHVSTVIIFSGTWSLSRLFRHISGSQIVAKWNRDMRARPRVPMRAA
jgi:hypothetical protein